MIPFIPLTPNGEYTQKPGQTFEFTKELNTVWDHYYDYKNVLEESGLGYNVEEVINRLHSDGYINIDDKKKYIDLVKKMERLDNDDHTFGKTYFEMFKKPSTLKEINSLLSDLAEYTPEIVNNKYDADAIRDALQGLGSGSNSGLVPGVAAPNYLDTNFAGYQLDVNPVKLWTGQELADLHNLDFNPDNYYDLVKKATSADVDLAHYRQAQQNSASMVTDAVANNTYLNSIRNNKANAIASGATAGRRAATEVLSNIQHANEYAKNQASVAQQNFALADKVLLADAQAQQAADRYYTSLAQNLGTNSVNLYMNDSDRFGQEMLTNAELYGADQALRGQRAYSNAAMEGDYISGNAQVGAANSGAVARRNEYAWVFDRFLGANNGNVNQAVKDMDQYIYGNYTRRTGPVDFISNQKK